MKQFDNYTQLSAYMDQLGLFHMDLSLSRMEKFLESMRAVDFPVVHVVGTNGKGSTASFFSSLCRGHGLKVGLFTSPHFLSPRERVQVNHRLLPEDSWVMLANQVLATPGGEELTYFEFQTCLAMLAFQAAGVDVAVMEAGLGGQFDATNVFSPTLTLFTPFGLDHEKQLGPTLTHIAKDKAGALLCGGVGITGPQEPEVMIVLEDRAKEIGARLVYAVDAADPIDPGDLGLGGIHQTVNARLALAGWRWFAAGRGLRTEYRREQLGLKAAFLPGRMQFVEVEGKTIILDGAHNSHALTALKAALDADDVVPDCVIFACLADKDMEPMLPLVRSLTKGAIVVPQMQSERARDAAELTGLIGESALVAESFEAALEMVSEKCSTTLVCGSLYLLAEFYNLYPESLTANQLD